MRRKKSKLEKFFSWNWHRRRLGRGDVAGELDLDFAEQARTRISGSEKTYTYGSEKNLQVHLENLREEFVGETELAYTHSKLIVLIRRACDTTENYALFEKLWDSQSEFLLRNLNTRWLVAAADTFADYSTDSTTRALAVSVTCLVNTVKIQESERFLQESEKAADSEERRAILQGERVALFDGTSAFAVGTDDTLRNMRWRIDKLAAESVAGELFLEVFQRLQEHDTVYARFRKRHTRDRTGWW